MSDALAGARARIRRALNRVSRWRQERRETEQADGETTLGTNTLKASFALGAAQARRTNRTVPASASAAPS